MSCDPTLAAIDDDVAMFLMGGFASIEIYENAANRVVVKSAHPELVVVASDLPTALRLWAGKFREASPKLFPKRENAVDRLARVDP